MRSEILNLLREKSPQPVSGQDLANHFGITRTAVWKHIQSLKKMGYGIEAYTKKGYVLVSVPNKLLPEEISRHLHTRFIGRNMAYEDVIPSTNDLLKKMALQGAPDGTVCVAEEQSVGKGRLARGWFSPYGKGLWFSLLLKPTFLPQEAPKMTLLAAVAVVRAVRELCGVKAEIKWPNDILLEGRKLVGILTEMSAEFGHINYLVVGIGINVCQRREDFLPELRETAASLSMIAGAEIDRAALETALLEELESLRRELPQETAERRQEYSAACLNLGRRVRVLRPDGERSALAVSLTPDYGLAVRYDDGTEEVLRSGEVSVRGLYGYTDKE